MESWILSCKVEISGFLLLFLFLFFSRYLPVWTFHNDNIFSREWNGSITDNIRFCQSHIFSVKFKDVFRHYFQNYKLLYEGIIISHTTMSIKSLNHKLLWQKGNDKEEINRFIWGCYYKLETKSVRIIKMLFLFLRSNVFLPKFTSV